MPHRWEVLAFVEEIVSIVFFQSQDNGRASG
jgi:hypothetical protein